ncbi:MAG: GntR family transcriptional regulator [Christensenellales bacterium]
MESRGLEKSEKIRYQRMPELVKEQLMDWIMDGTFVMGDRLNAEELAARLGVSRMPVREALKSMEKSGIVHSIPYVGTRVTELQMTDIVQIYLMRKALEPLASYYACKNVTDYNIQIIERLHNEIKEVTSVLKPNAKQIFVLNREFHFEIYKTSNMQYLINIISTLWDNLAFYKLIYGRRYSTDKSSAQNMLNEHQGYIDKLKDKDAQGLKQLMRESLQKRILELKDQVTYEI